MEKFARWLEQELATRNWKQADLVRATGLDAGYISHLLSERRNPGVEACSAIAKAFKLPPADVMRAAGLLPPADPDVDPDVEVGRELLQQMGEGTREQAVRLLRMMLEAQEREDRKKEHARPSAQRRRSSAT